jgi:hypothetical protein
MGAMPGETCPISIVCQLSLWNLRGKNVRCLPRCPFSRLWHRPTDTTHESLWCLVCLGTLPGLGAVIREADGWTGKRRITEAVIALSLAVLTETVVPAALPLLMAMTAH